MYYEVTSRHRKGFLTQTLTVRAADPDEACEATYGAWDMDDRLITKIRQLEAYEETPVHQESHLLTAAMVVCVLVAFISLLFFGPTP